MRPETLELAPLNCSLDPVLGDYYQDLTAAIVLVESGYHGSLDAEGVPLVRYGDQGLLHNSVIASQYALANMTASARGEGGRGGKARVQLDWLVRAQEASGELAGFWPMTHDNRKYPWLVAPWVSAMASGMAISALLRGWELFGADEYRKAATIAYVALHDAGRALSVCVEEAGDELWYEEYPAEPPLHVLNGHVYALLGVADYARITGDPEAHGRWRRAAATAIDHLDGYDLGYWSAYDLRTRAPVSLHYQKNIHVPQLQILAELTGDSRATEMAMRWERSTRKRSSRLRWQVELRLQRWRRQPSISAPRTRAPS